MTFSRLILSAASIAASAAFAPALAQEHEVGHWFSAPGTSTAPAMAAQPVFVGGVLVASGDVSGDGRQFNGFVSRFPAGGRDALPATPLEDPRLQTPEARQEGKGNELNHYAITFANATAAAGGDRDMTLKGQHILQNAREIRPVAGVGSSDSKTWVRTAQPHTSMSAPILPPQMGWGRWEVQPGRVLNAPPAAGMRPGPMPGGHAAPTRR
jgi:hypothetical protein